MSQRTDGWEKFLRDMRAFEEGPEISDFQRLLAVGIELPDPESLDDAALTAKLWEVIEQLARLQVFLYCTNHLSDRKLYSKLWRETLHEETPVIEPDEASAWHVDMVGTGSEEDIRAYLQFYADEPSRQRWREDFPDMPPHEEPLYDRDRFLPQFGADRNELG